MTGPEKREQTNIKDVFGSVLSGVFNAPVYVTNLINEQVFKRFGIEQRIGFILLAFLFISGIVGLYFALRPKQPTQMAGDFRIAVAGFVENGSSWKSKLGMELAQDVFVRLDENFGDMELDFKITVWGPDQTGIVKGATQEERAYSAERIASEIGADIVVYGAVNTTNQEWEITPEFYVASENFYEAQEVVGQYAIGEPFAVNGGGRTLTRTAINDKLSDRVTILSQITVGLARYALRDYVKALETFQSAVVNSKDIPGVQKLLYLLMGNAAGKLLDVDAAETYHQTALNLDPEYARAYVGLADAYYIRSLEVFSVTMQTADIDTVGLHRAIETYNRALSSENQPSLADIPTKVHFGLGQCYLMLVYAGEQEFFDPAIVEFEAVIQEYDDGKNPRLRERAAESYGRLGLVYALAGYRDLAIEHYELAVSLLEDNPKRQEDYRLSIEKLKNLADD